MKKLVVCAVVGGVLLGITSSSRADEVTQLRQKVAELEAKVRKQDKSLEQLAQQLEGVTPTAVQAPFGRFFVVKGNTHALALQFYEYVPEKASAKYRWYLQTDGSFDFSKPNVKKGHAVITERDSGDAILKHGGFEILWSYGSWFYYPYSKSQIGFAPTNFTWIEDVKRDKLFFYQQGTTRLRYPLPPIK